MNIFWFRRDLRLLDNHGLYKSLLNNRTQTIFIFDTFILNKILNKYDPRVQYIYDSLKYIHCYLKKIYNSSLKIYKGEVLECWKQIIDDFSKINFVFFNEDYEPYALKRDYLIIDFLYSYGIHVFSFKDQVIYAPNEILKKNKSPYTIYSAYSKKWKEKLNNEHILSYDLSSNFYNSNFDFPSLNFLGFFSSSIKIAKLQLNENVIKNYHIHRNFPYLNLTSNLSVYLRFGTVSIRKIIKNYQLVNEQFINELIWREFFMQILYHFPENEHYPFKKKYNNIIWMNDDYKFHQWKIGKLGFPLLDAGMRELNQTGRMHNRLRMLSANFLTKYLLIDWKLGEHYFAEKLLDFDLASNNGNWQWSAGCGCDAVPYFRIFNPEIQQKKFDPNLIYIKKWIPEINNVNQYHLHPIIDLKSSRNKSLLFFKNYLTI